MVIPLATDDASPEVTSAIESFSSLDQLQAASVNYRIAIGPHAGRKALTLYSVPPIATKRLSVDGRGRVVYQYKHPFRDGSTQVVLEPLSCSDF
jgi:hypothetical protein